MPFDAYRYGQATVFVHDSDPLVVTRFNDGAEVRAVPEPTEDYEARARELGYADGAAMSREHDEIHCQIARMLGLGVSPVLWATAHETPVDRALGAFEEDAVMAVARLKNACRAAGLL